MNIRADIGSSDYCAEMDVPETRTEGMVIGRSFIALLLACMGAASTACPAHEAASETGSTKSPAAPAPISVDEFLSIYSESERKAIEAQGYDHDEIASLISIDVEMARTLIHGAIEASSFRPLPAAVELGTAIAWIELASWPRETPIAFRRAFCGNLDGLPGVEILLLGGNNDAMIKPDSGAVSPLEEDLPLPEMLWDFGADGVDELVREVPHYQSESGVDWMKVYDLTDSLVHSFDCSLCGPIIIPGDFDGDGQTDLAMSAVLASGEEGPLLAYNHRGEKILELPFDWNTPFSIAADVDGDGQDEIATFGFGTKARAAGIGQEIVELTQIEEKEHFSPSLSVDLDGDGRDELIDSGGDVVNLATNARFDLERPEGLKRLHIDALFAPGVAILAGPTRIMAAPSRIGIIGDLVCTWNSNGELEYLEYMGEEVEQLIAVTDASGQTRPLVLTATRLLLAP